MTRIGITSPVTVTAQESTLFEFWEGELRAYEHYIPVKADLSDLVKHTHARTNTLSNTHQKQNTRTDRNTRTGPQVERVEWALAHDAESRAIGERARRWVATRLTSGRVLCYWAALLTRYSRVQAFRPRPVANATRALNLGLWHLS